MIIFFQAVSQMKKKKINLFQETTSSLSISPLLWEGRDFTHYLRKGCKGFSSWTKHPVKSIRSWHNLPGETLHDGARSVAQRRPILEISKIYTHTHERKIRLQWVLDYSNPDYPYPDVWMSGHVAMFSVPEWKICCSHWSLPQEKAKLLYEWLSHTLQRFFHAVRGIYITIYNVWASRTKPQML